MELITEYIKPELIVVAVVLYIVGIDQWAQDGKRHLRYSRPLFREFLLQEQVLTSIRF